MTSSPETSDPDTRSLARDSVRTTLTNIAIFVLGILIWIATARFLTTHLRGVIALIMVVPGLVVRIGLFGMEQGIVVMSGADRKLLGPLTRTAGWFGLGAGFLMMALMAGFMYGFPKTFHSVIQLWPNLPFLVIILAFPIHLMTIAFDAAVYAEDRIAARNMKELTVNAVMLTAMLVAFIVFDFRLFAVVGAYIAANLLSLIYSAILLIGRMKFKGKTSLDLMKKAIKIGFPINLAQVATYIMLPAMIVVLSMALGGSPAENLTRIAFFAMGYQMVDRLLPVTRSIAFALLPKITGGTDEVASELAAKASRHTLLASLVLYAVLVLLAQPIVAILLGARYLPVATSFMIMAPGGVALSVGGVWAAHLLARGKPYKVAWAGIMGVLTALILSGIGFRYLHGTREVLVASIAVVTGSIVNAGILLPAFCRTSKITAVRALIPRIDDIRQWRRIPGFVRELTNRGKD